MIAEAMQSDTTTLKPTSLDCRVLVVDNEPSQRFLLRWLLQAAGAEVETASSGQAAVLAVQAAELEASPYDVVLTDLTMPVLDGYATLAALRQLGQRVPVIAMSKDNRSELPERCQDAGFDAFVHKFRIREQLVVTLSQHVGTSDRPVENANA